MGLRPLPLPWPEGKGEAGPVLMRPSTSDAAHDAARGKIVQRDGVWSTLRPPSCLCLVGRSRALVSVPVRDRVQGRPAVACVAAVSRGGGFARKKCTLLQRIRYWYTVL